MELGVIGFLEETRQGSRQTTATRRVWGYGPFHFTAWCPISVLRRLEEVLVKFIKKALLCHRA